MQGRTSRKTWSGGGANHWVTYNKEQDVLIGIVSAVFDDMSSTVRSYPIEQLALKPP